MLFCVIVQDEDIKVYFTAKCKQASKNDAFSV